MYDCHFYVWLIKKCIFGDYPGRTIKDASVRLGFGRSQCGSIEAAIDIGNFPGNTAS